MQSRQSATTHCRSSETEDVRPSRRLQDRRLRKWLGCRNDERDLAAGYAVATGTLALRRFAGCTFEASSTGMYIGSNVLLANLDMLEQFQSLDIVRTNNVPTLLAFDPKRDSLVIGEEAKLIAARHQPVVQDFKLAIGESDAMFEGRFTASSSAKPQRNWELRHSGSDAERLISTREATKSYLARLLAGLERLPEQLVIGIPASKDRVWLAQYRTHLTAVLQVWVLTIPNFSQSRLRCFSTTGMWKG